MISRPATHQFNCRGPYHGIIDGAPALITALTKTMDYQTIYGPCGTIGRVAGPVEVHIEATTRHAIQAHGLGDWEEVIFVWIDGLGEYRASIVELTSLDGTTKIKMVARQPAKISSAKHGKQYPSKHELRLAMKEIVRGNTGMPNDFLTNRAALKRWLRSMQAERERTSRRAMRRQTYYDSMEPHMEGYFE